MNDDQIRALLLTAALLSGASGSLGFAGGRMSVADPPPEVRLVRMPPRVIRIPMAEAVPAAPETAVPEVPAAPAAAETPVTAPPVPVETTPLPPPRPKVETKPKPKPSPPKHEKDAPARKPRPVLPAKKLLPTCAVIQREYDAMTWPERMAAYRRATAEEIAQGKRCLGL